MWELELGPTLGPEDPTTALAEERRYHRDCIKLRLSKEATPQDLLRLLHGAGRHAELAFDPATWPACVLDSGH